MKSSKKTPADYVLDEIEHYTATEAADVREEYKENIMGFLTEIEKKHNEAILEMLEQQEKEMKMKQADDAWESDQEYKNYKKAMAREKKMLKKDEEKARELMNTTVATKVYEAVETSINETEREHKTDAMGHVGEKIVYDYLKTKFTPEMGFHIEWEELNKYDSKKDMRIVFTKTGKAKTFEVKTFEVKTQVPFITKNAFTVRPNQVEKCKNVDFLFIVSVGDPSWDGEYKHFNKVYFCDKPSELVYSGTTVTKAGDTMTLIPINQKGLKSVKTLNEQEIEQLQKYSVSGKFAKENTMTLEYRMPQSYDEKSIREWVDEWASSNEALTEHKEFFTKKLLSNLKKVGATPNMAVAFSMGYDTMHYATDPSDAKLSGENPDRMIIDYTMVGDPVKRLLRG